MTKGYVIIMRRGDRLSFVQMTRGCLHTTTLSLGVGYPHLLKVYKTKAAAKGILTRLLRKYTDHHLVENADFYVEPYKRTTP